MLKEIKDLTETVETEQWEIKSDGDADWYIEVANEDLEKEQRLLEQIQEKIKFYKDREQIVLNRIQNLKDSRDSALLRYMDSVDQDLMTETKTQRKYELPSGSLILKKPRQRYKRDNDELVEWLRERDLKAYINVRETPRWGDLKKSTEIIDGKPHFIDSDTGELVKIKGVELEYTAEEFELKV